MNDANYLHKIFHVAVHMFIFSALHQLIHFLHRLFFNSRCIYLYNLHAFFFYMSDSYQGIQKNHYIFDSKCIYYCNAKFIFKYMKNHYLFRFNYDLSFFPIRDACIYIIFMHLSVTRKSHIHAYEKLFVFHISIANALTYIYQSLKWMCNCFKQYFYDFFCIWVNII